MITVHWIAAVVALFVAFLAGMWVGRSVRQMAAETEEGQSNKNLLQEGEVRENTRQGAEGAVHEENTFMRERIAGVKRIPPGRRIVSPVHGTVSRYYERNHRGAMIRPDEGQLYAPESGKIIRLYPMGNAMVLRTDYGLELLLKVGSQEDDFYSGFYRSRVIQNEIITRGKLLLEFDLKGLRDEGQEPMVTISVEGSGHPEDILLTEKEKVRVGEELMLVRTDADGDIPPERRDKSAEIP